MEKSATKTADQLLAELRALAVQLTDLTKNKVQETNEPLLFGNGGADFRLIGGKPAIGIATSFGVVTLVLEPAGLIRMIGQLLIAQAGAIDVQVAQVQAEAVKNNGPLN